MHSEETTCAPGTAAEHLIDHPGFWPAYLEPFLGTEIDLVEAFDANPGDVRDAASTLFGGDSHHLLTLGLADRHAIEIHITNLDLGDERDNSVDYTVVHPTWSRPGFLATIGADASGPGLAWTELHSVVASTAPEAPLSPTVRLLLLLPILGDEDTPHGRAAPLIADAFAAHGAMPAAVPVLTELALESPYFGPAAWTVDPQHGTGVLICDGPDCARTVPIAHGGITARQSHQLARILGAAT
ncbi:hypothetical protein [Yinghuangia sp. YIM S09857]|uniref:hypothetical protein n=1 Tax=Yinghuangia sp. YIM S09857 TaxID=3436929 RepID=UPI003F533E49